MSRRTALVVLALLQTATFTGAATAALARPAEPALVAAPAAPFEVEHPTHALPHVVAAKPVRRPAPKRVVHRPRPVVRHVTPHVVRHRVVHRTTLSPEQRMMRAVARIPGYHSGDAQWAISSAWGHWGVADLYGGTAYISPTVPADRMYDVVAHEWSHLLTVKAYGGDVMGALAATNSWFGGSNLTGEERAADCMARILGATWTHYTSCTNATWRQGARRLLARQRL
jgi:hypothetical protein